MPGPVYTYDETSDTLYVSFSPGAHGTGIELNEHIILRVDKKQGAAIGVTFLDYSLLAQATEAGPRSFPLTGLAQLSEELRDLVLALLRRPPVSDILRISLYTPSISEAIPITFLQSAIPTAA